MGADWIRTKNDVSSGVFWQQQDTELKFLHKWNNPLFVSVTVNALPQGGHYIFEVHQVGDVFVS